MISQLDAVDAAYIFRKGLLQGELGQRLEAMSSLVQSINIFPYNWSAWLKLTDLLDGEEEVSVTLSFYCTPR